MLRAVAAARAAALFAPRWRAEVLGSGRMVARLKAAAKPAAPALPAPGPSPRVLRWTPHLVVRAADTGWCLACCQQDRSRTSARLRGSPCPGVSAPSSSLMGLLLAGAFDASLAKSGPAVLGRALALGWHPVGRPPEVCAAGRPAKRPRRSVAPALSPAVADAHAPQLALGLKRALSPASALRDGFARLFGRPAL